MQSTVMTQGTVITIGNFDGCHLGHQSLVKQALAIAVQEDLIPKAYTFEPHPMDFFAPQHIQPKLFNRHQKQKALEEMGLHEVVLQDFDRDFSMLSHAQFFYDVLIKKHHARAIIVGENFRFGHQRQGDTRYLQKEGDKAGVQIIAAQPLSYEDENISSSRVRHALTRNGDVDLAQKLLGRPYRLESTVVKGQQLGRKLGFPTANFSPVEQLIPRNGVYAGFAVMAATAPVMSLPNAAIPAVMNIGVRPSVSKEGHEPTVEAHLLSGQYDEDSLYGEPIVFYFHQRLRDEVKFENVESLRQQIQLDVEAAKQILGVAS